MASWEDFSRIITEAKESKKLDPVDDDVNSDGKVDMNGSKVGCNDPDPRSMKTQVNLVKNKLRAMGLKMSQELEGEQLDEIAPLIAGGLALAGALAAGSAIKRAQDAAKSGVDAANKGQKVKPGIGIGNASYGMQRHNNQLRDAMKQMNSYEPEGELVDEGKKDLPQTKMYRKAGNLARQALSSKGAKKEKAMDRSAKIVSAITRETERKRFDEIGKSPAHNSNYKEDFEIEEGMSLKDFKSNRRKITGAEERADARKRGHEGKTWADSGRTYSPDEAKSRRTKISDVDRSARHSTAVDPDNEDTDSYSADKTKNPKKLRKQKAMGELGEGYIEEKSLSRAQQRFFGMVRAAQDGKMKSPSPEVAKAAKEMTTKQAHDFAATKHKGLPEKKEEPKEEFSLVDTVIAQFSPLNEAPENTIPGGKRRKGLSKTIQSRQVDKLADEGDYERADKLQDVSSVKLKK